MSSCLHQDAQVNVHWPLLYANRRLIGQGSVLCINETSCKVIGTMPVAAGMVLKVWISPEHLQEALFVKEARVLWARGQEFWLELHQVDPQDQQWLVSFLENAGLETKNAFLQRLVGEREGRGAP